tara:strand:+ start:858 stop:1127 length:270 start_codon:yes stop_codon:yes gene_type:complete
MERLVFCKKYQKELPGLQNPPYPGPKGEEIYQSVSNKAWQEWLNHQTMLINEGQLNLTDKASRNWLKEQMELFLSNGDYEKPKGFKPEV